MSLNAVWLVLIRSLRSFLSMSQCVTLSISLNSSICLSERLVIASFIYQITKWHFSFKNHRVNLILALIKNKLWKDSYGRLAEMAGKSHAERRKKKLYAARGPRDIVELPRPDDELGMQLRSISRNSTNRASGTSNKDMAGSDDVIVPEVPVVVPKLRNSQKLRNSHRLSESFLNPR